MTETDDQLTKTQLFGMMVLGVCVWAIFLGLGYAIVKWSLDGLIVAGAGAIGSFVLVKWLIAINHKNR